MLLAKQTFDNVFALAEIRNILNPKKPMDYDSLILYTGLKDYWYIATRATYDQLKSEFDTLTTYLKGIYQTLNSHYYKLNNIVNLHEHENRDNRKTVLIWNTINKIKIYAQELESKRKLIYSRLLCEEKIIFMTYQNLCEFGNNYCANNELENNIIIEEID
jgi:hypothetical protein